MRYREETMRELKNIHMLLGGCQIYHNYIRPYEELNSQTPAEACGMTIEGNNRWLTPIGNAFCER